LSGGAAGSAPACLGHIGSSQGMPRSLRIVIVVRAAFFMRRSFCGLGERANTCGCSFCIRGCASTYLLQRFGSVGSRSEVQRLILERLTQDSERELASVIRKLRNGLAPKLLVAQRTFHKLTSCFQRHVRGRIQGGLAHLRRAVRKTTPRNVER